MNLREKQISQLRQSYFDVLIIGGGINGAVCAASLSKQGVSVALVEKNDFASFSSQESSNLIWGGIKYLQSLELSLVRSLCKSRNLLMKLFPSNVQEVRFLAMIEKKHKFHPFVIYMATILYWLLGNCSTRPPKYLRRSKIKEKVPALNVDISNGGFEFSDAFLIENDARFVLNFIKSALENGGVLSNYIEALGSKYNQKGWITTVKDKTKPRQASLKIRSKVLINACGPYTDNYNQLSKQSTLHKHLFSKGIHLIVPNFYNQNKILSFFSNDNRPFFTIPMGNKLCIGTTDTIIKKLECKVNEKDRQFVLDNINSKLCQKMQLRTKDIIAERCGVRPLAVSKANINKIKSIDFISLTRKHVIEVDKNKKHLSIYGGKLTDCLNVAKEVSHELAKMNIACANPRTQVKSEDSKTDKDHFFQKVNDLNLDEQQKHPHRKNDKKTESNKQRLWRLYGNKGLWILDKIMLDTTMAEVVIEGTEMMRAELYYMASYEMIVTLEDFLRRRTKFAIIVPKNKLKKLKGLNEACKILFKEKAKKKLDEYFKHNIYSISL